MRKNDQQPWVHVANTETAANQQNPKWRTAFHLEYEFHKPLELRFEVQKENLAGFDELVGYVECPLVDLVIQSSQV